VKRIGIRGEEAAAGMAGKKTKAGEKKSRALQKWNVGRGLKGDEWILACTRGGGEKSAPNWQTRRKKEQRVDIYHRVSGGQGKRFH